MFECSFLTLSLVAGVTPPYITGLSPADDAEAVPAPNTLQITFNEFVQRDSAEVNITIFDDSTIGYPHHNITLGQSMTVGYVTTIPIGQLSPGKRYHVYVPYGAFSNFVNANFAGILNTSGWNFITAGK